MYYSSLQCVIKAENWYCLKSKRTNRRQNHGRCKARRTTKNNIVVSTCMHAFCTSTVSQVSAGRAILTSLSLYMLGSDAPISGDPRVEWSSKRSHYNFYRPCRIRTLPERRFTIARSDPECASVHITILIALVGSDPPRILKRWSSPLLHLPTHLGL